MSQALPCLKNFHMPFYYASLHNIWCYYLADPTVVKPFVDNPKLTPAILNGQAVVNFNFQTYAAQFYKDKMNSWTTELELNVLVYPTALASMVPSVSLQQFLIGEEVTRFIGHYRVKVPANNRIAILAGKAAFGEPKFPGLFDSAIPSLNSPKNSPNESGHTWTFTISAPMQYQTNPGPPWKPGEKIVSCTISLANMSGVQANPCPISYYGQQSEKFDTFPPPDPSYYFEIPAYDPKILTIGARWNIQLAAMTYGDGETPLAPETVRLDYGSTPYEGCKEAMERLIDGARCMAVQTMVSQPVAIESGAYYIEPMTQ